MTRYLVGGLLAIVIGVAPISPIRAVVPDRQYQLGEPTAHDKQAFSEARCVWRSQYDQTLSFVSRMTRGIRARKLLRLVDTLAIPCARKKKTPRGDIVAALVHLRDNEVGRCIDRAAPSAFRKFIARVKGKSETSPAVIEFVNGGFTPDLLSAATKCDPDLAREHAVDERQSFWTALNG